MSNEKTFEFEKDDVCYDAQGNILQYIAVVADNNHCVRKHHLDEDGEVVSEEIALVRHVFKAPPVEAKHAEINRLNEQVKILGRQIAEKQSQSVRLDKKIRDLDKEFDQRIARIKSNEQLKNIDLFLSGGITHFVIGGGSCDTKIKTFDQAINYFDNDDRKNYQRLLSLYGDAKRKVTWGIAQYGDGSGHFETATPFTSYEEALAYAKDIHTKELTRISREYDFDSRSHVYQSWADKAVLLDLEIPSDLAEKLNSRGVENAKKELERLEREHLSAAAKVASARSKLNALEVEQIGS